MNRARDRATDDHFARRPPFSSSLNADFPLNRLGRQAGRAYRENASAAPPANFARAPNASSIRRISFHLAVRSPRAIEPTLSCPAFQPTARCAIVTSSDSPERAETIAPRPHACAARSAASVSVTVPA